MSLTESLLLVLIIEVLVATTLVSTYWKFRIEPKMDAVLEAGHVAKVESRLANTLAGSALKDSRQLNEDTKLVVEEGVKAAATVAANLAAGVVPPSGDKLLKPVLPEPAL